MSDGKTLNLTAQMVCLEQLHLMLSFVQLTCDLISLKMVKVLTCKDTFRSKHFGVLRETVAIII